MQVHPSGGYYPWEDDDDYSCDDDHLYNTTFPWPQQSPHMTPAPPPPMNTVQWIPPHQTYGNNMDPYASYDHTALYPQFRGGGEQQYYTFRGTKGVSESGKHQSGGQYPGSNVYGDVERYGVRAPSDEQSPYYFEQNKPNHHVWISRGISD